MLLGGVSNAGLRSDELENPPGRRTDAALTQEKDEEEFYRIPTFSGQHRVKCLEILLLYFTAAMLNRLKVSAAALYVSWGPMSHNDGQKKLSQSGI